MMFDQIAVIGAGAWGTALANAAAETGRAVLLWGRDDEHVSAMVRERSNARYLPGIALADGVTPSSSLSGAARARLILLVVPAQSLRAVALEMAPMVAANTPVIACAKGIERATGAFMTQVIAEVMPSVLPGILSGPSFADDVASGLPTAVTLAAADEDIARGLAQALSTQTFRVYHSTDMRGVEIGGAAKNVLAIAAGVVAGLKLGESARAALVARGFAELMRFARAFGGRGETLMGLSGLGDLVLTCGSEKSRNFALGLTLGRGLAFGRGKDGDSASGAKLAEGAFTASVLAGMAAEKGIDMPIVTAVDALLQGRMNALQLVNELMSRPVRAEE